ncbi:MAG: hypothetical protein M3441_17235 [Chloroflexota bacterium]|nr:hypothetical protein [Chloroflexota bacterium]
MQLDVFSTILLGIIAGLLTTRVDKFLQTLLDYRRKKINIRKADEGLKYLERLRYFKANPAELTVHLVTAVLAILLSVFTAGILLLFLISVGGQAVRSADVAYTMVRTATWILLLLCIVTVLIMGVTAGFRALNVAQDVRHFDKMEPVLEKQIAKWQSNSKSPQS